MTSDDQKKKEHGDNDTVLTGGDKSNEGLAEPTETLEIKNASAKSGQGDAKDKAKQQAKEKSEGGPVLFEKSYMDAEAGSNSSATALTIIILLAFAMLLVTWKLYLYHNNSGNDPQRAAKQFALDEYRTNIERKLRDSQPLR